MNGRYAKQAVILVNHVSRQCVRYLRRQPHTLSGLMQEAWYASANAKLAARDAEDIFPGIGGCSIDLVATPNYPNEVFEWKIDQGL